MMLKRISVLVLSIALFSCSKEIIQQKLTVDWTPLNGGTVSPPTNAFEKGTVVSMIATPAGEYAFKQWSGSLSGNNNPSPITLDADKQVTGIFEKRQYSLSLTIEGSGTVKEEVIAIAPQAQYPSGTIVRLTPQPADKYEFGGWSGDLTSSANPLDLKIDKAISLKALFQKIKFPGYKVDPNAKQLGTEYWGNTPLLSDLIVAVYQKNYEYYDPARAYTVFSTAICNGDFNNDGYLDVFNAGTAYNGKKANLSFLIWNPTSQQFEEKNLLNDKTDFIGAPYKVSPIYLNGDNYVDLVIHGHADEGRENTNEPVRLCLSDGKGGYDLVKLELEPKELSNMFTHESGDVADINKDGNPDLFVVANSHSYIFWGIASYPYFTNVNFAHFASDTKNYTSDNSFGESVSILNSSFNCRILDLNKDGLKDLFVAGQSENTILFNKGNGRFTSNDFKKIPFSVPNGINVFDYIVDDLNNDGLNDIITLNAESYKKWNIEIYFQNADGSFKVDNSAIEYTINQERPNWKTRLIYFDFDGDGKKDITYSDAGINAYTNKSIINDIKLKSVFIRSNNKFVEKDFFKFDPYANELKEKYY
jgi:hypothetical protein